MTTEKNIKSQTRAWSLYDWANSAFSLTITSAIFPIYFEIVTASKAEMLRVWDIQIQNTALYSFILAFSFLIVALINPLLSGLSDVAGLKKRFLTLFTLLGSLSCAFLYFFSEEYLWIGISGFALSTIGYAGSLVFYNAYLPEISTPDRFDKLSAQGFAMGYAGSMILLIINLICISFFDTFGFADSKQATRFAFLSVGIWWACFGLYSISKMPHSPTVNTPQGLLKKGYLEALQVQQSIRKVPVQSKFLLAFFFYSMGVQTVMYIATLFGTKELHLESSKLIIVILLIQLLGIAGAYFFAFISKIKGTFFSISIMLFVWIAVCVSAYFIKTATHFYILAVAVGAVMGGTQSQSRSAFASIIPGKKDNASYFSFYELTEKVAIFIGTLSYGILIQITGGMRNSVILLASFFIAGLFFMWKLQIANKKNQWKPMP